MSLPDAVIKLAQLLESARVAAKLLLAAVILSFGAWRLREAIAETAGELGIGPLPLYGVLSVAAYATAGLLVEAVTRGVSGILSFRRAASDRMLRIRQQAALRERRQYELATFLDHEGSGHARILVELLEAPSKEYLKGAETTRLQSLAAIEQVTETRSGYAAFRLSPDAEDFVRDYFRRRREWKVRQALDKLTDQDLAFLHLFTVVRSEYEGAEETALLPRELYSAATNMVRLELLRRPAQPAAKGWESWAIPSDVEALLATERGFVFMRTQFTLSLSRVQASAATGGSGTGGVRRVPQLPAT